MPVWFTMRGRRASKPTRLGQPGVAHVLAAAVLGLTLLGAQSSMPNRTAVAMDSQDCLPDGSGHVRVTLSGAVEYSIEWHDSDLECGGHRNKLQFGGLAAGAGSFVDLTFDIEVEEGATGDGLPARVGITDRASERYFQTSEAGGCLVNVTEHSLIDENPAFRRYKLAANGSCTITSLQYSGPGGAGAAEIAVGDFEIVGIAVWM